MKLFKSSTSSQKHKIKAQLELTLSKLTNLSEAAGNIYYIDWSISSDKGKSGKSSPASANGTATWESPEILTIPFSTELDIKSSVFDSRKLTIRINEEKGKKESRLAKLDIELAEFSKNGNEETRTFPAGKDGSPSLEATLKTTWTRMNNKNLINPGEDTDATTDAVDDTVTEDGDNVIHDSTEDLKATTSSEQNSLRVLSASQVDASGKSPRSASTINLSSQILEIETLQTASRRDVQSIRDKLDAFNDLETKYKQSEENLLRKEDEIATVRKNLEHTKKMQDVSYKRVATLEQKVRDVQGEMEAVRKEASGHSAEKIAALQAYNKTVRKLEEANKSLESAKKTIAEQEEEIEELKRLLRQLRESNSSDAERELLAAQNERDAQREAERKRREAELLEKIRVLEGKNGELEQIIKELEAKLRESQSQSRDLPNEGGDIEELKKQIQDLKKQLSENEMNYLKIIVAIVSVALVLFLIAAKH